MKTKEFISKAKELGWSINKTASTIEIINPMITTTNYVMVSISEDSRTVFEINTPVDYETLDLIVAYARTPLEDRKEPEKKYFIKVLPGEYGYLSVQQVNNCGKEDIIKYGVSYKHHNDPVKSTFTMKELADIS